MAKRDDDDGDHTFAIVATLIVLGLLAGSCHPARTGGPVEHTCWFETGEEMC